jgi:prepilin signal peptidase PulO-like enzyme (type II secretory pathway)
MEEKEMFLLGLLTIIAYVDIRQRRIPLFCILTGWGYWVVCLFRNGGGEKEELLFNIIAAIFLMGICMILRLVWKDCIGWGDILLLGMMALAAGRMRLFGNLIITFSIFIVYSIVLIIGGCSKKTTVPFAPFLWIGYAVICLLEAVGI